MNNKSLKFVCSGVFLIVPMFLLLSGCAPSQQEIMARSKLEKARATYNETSANPVVANNAPVALLEAEKQIKAAESTDDFVEMEHFAYLADRKTQTAVAIADKKVAEKEMEKLSKESSAVLLAKRERQLKAAQSLADTRTLELEKARQEAEQRTRDLEKARQEAESMAGKSEELQRLAEAKVREAEQAQLLAESRAQQVEQARQVAEAQTREAEQSKLLAEAKAREAEKSKSESEQLLKELTELKAKQTERGIVLTVGDVLFETGQARLSPRAEKSVTKLATFLNKNLKRNILIEGHTDSVGSADYNLKLSKRRANSVRDNLMAKGISPERITTRGYGENYPVSTNDTKIGRQLNRRVEVIILNEGVSPESVAR